MSKTNCKNCGAALDICSPKCAFCGTKNINMTDIDLSSGEAANFIFKMPHNIRVEDKEGNEIYMTMLAVPELKAFEITSNTMSVNGGWGCQPILSYNTGSTINMGINLRAVSRSDTEELCTLTIR